MRHRYRTQRANLVQRSRGIFFRTIRHATICYCRRCVKSRRKQAGHHLYGKSWKTWIPALVSSRGLRDCAGEICGAPRFAQGFPCKITRERTSLPGTAPTGSGTWLQASRHQRLCLDAKTISVRDSLPGPIQDEFSDEMLPLTVRHRTSHELERWRRESLVGRFVGGKE